MKPTNPSHEESSPHPESGRAKPPIVSNPRDSSLFTAVVSSARSLVAAMRASSDFPPDVQLADEPLHPEFLIILRGWYWNGKGGLGGLDDRKVRILFTSAEFTLLDNCPFHCKFGRNKDATSPYTYCGFAYPGRDHDLEHICAWAKRFPQAAVFTRGDFVDGKWVPGTFVESLT